MKIDAATAAQLKAARPEASTWLSANAGSGKTRVLTDRVARLLLEGVSPAHILCLTYTKAAASEMQNRLFKRLGDWAMRGDDDLRERLVNLGLNRSLEPDFLRDARTLFARAIETPGGLRIQTIHSFCASVLRRFPLEAGVSPQFAEMEDRAAELLRAELLDRMADGPEVALVAGVAPFLTADVDDFLRDLTGHRDGFAANTADTIRKTYGLGDGASADTVMADLFAQVDFDRLRRIAETLLSVGGTFNHRTAGKLMRVTAADPAGWAALEAAFLTGKGKVSSQLATKAAIEGPLATDWPHVLDLAATVEGLRNIRLGLLAAERDIALHAFASAFLTHYADEKQRRGWLDFDDLITRTRDLLSDPKVADWVLYRLDGGIDHILVDEAQDTSPVQWQVIERLAAEFTSGQGARGELQRTIFVVGDKKQSIYSFQGADPREFDRMRDDFATRLSGTDGPLVESELRYSFRSAAPILDVVDATFADRAEAGFVQEQRHIAFKNTMPGRVDLWPVVDKTGDEEDGPWFAPVDRAGSRHETVVLARRIAHFIKAEIARGTPLAVEKDGVMTARPIHAGDVLILVRRRSQLFAEIIRACKQEGLPMAGADRLKVMAELAVRDVVALLSFLATPKDNLSLASALRSPLFGFSEQDLFTLAQGRGDASLWEVLRKRAKDHPTTLSIIEDLRMRTDFLRPYDLIDRILTRHRGRRLLIGRLGPEAEDGINALLQQALAYEQSDVPSLTGFLQWVQTDDLEIKRAPDAAGDRVRVMTVHGAKGLEAPVVILPDCGDMKDDIKAQLIRQGDHVMWKQTANNLPAAQSEMIDTLKAAQSRERDRLLYVGMTRAEKWLIVTAAGKVSKPDAWYNQVAAGMEASQADETQFDFGPHGSGAGLSLVQGDPNTLDIDTVLPETTQSPAAPAWADRPAIVPEKPPVLTPSDLGGAKALSGADGDETDLAKARGTAIHLLLEHLAAVAPGQRAQVAPKLMPPVPEEIHPEPIIAEALAVLSEPALAPVFTPDALTEVPFTADIPGLGRVHGVIDRLIVTEDRVLAVDFKSNRTIPPTPDAVPEGVLRQMGAYAAALAQIYPQRRIDVVVVWTAGPHYMSLPNDLVTQALARAAAS